MAMTRNYQPVLCLLTTLLAAFLLSSVKLTIGSVGSLQCNETNKNTLIAMKNLTKPERDKLVAAHNKYREIIAAGQEPGQLQAQDMVELTWNAHAAKQAYDWASGCKFEHNDPTSKKGEPMGQNLYIQMNSSQEDVNTTFYKNVDKMVKGWYDEVKLYRYGDGFSGATGHYTQVVWANTSKVGCGYSYYYQNVSRWYTSYLVCNYFPAGNWYGQNPYVVGNGTCNTTIFFKSTRKTYPHLCRYLNDTRKGRTKQTK